MTLQPKPARLSRTEHTQIVLKEHINGQNRLFGGRLMEWIDVVAAVAARRHAGHNVTTAIGVAQSRGVILLAIRQAGLPVFQYKPMQVKQAVVGYGNATKHQVQDMTKRLLHLEKLPKPDDAADAIAIALCHARSSTSLLARYNA